MPRRMSVTPVASQTRTPPGTGIIAAPGPNSVMVSAALGMANAIITETALSFLGLGFPSDFATWGRLLFDTTDYLQQYPGRVLWPDLAISLTVLSVNYMGDGLRDALDPRAHALSEPSRAPGALSEYSGLYSGPAGMLLPESRSNEASRRSARLPALG